MCWCIVLRHLPHSVQLSSVSAQCKLFSVADVKYQFCKVNCFVCFLCVTGNLPVFIKVVSPEGLLGAVEFFGQILQEATKSIRGLSE